MIGSTGVGKTEIARRLAALANAPFIKVEASKFTEVGYVGRDVESIVRDLMDTAVALVEREKYHDVIELAEHLANERILDILYPEEKNSNSKQDEKLKERQARTRNRIRKKLEEGDFEDKIIEKDTNYSLRIVRAIKRNDDHYGPLLVWIIGRIINVSVVSLQNTNSRKSLESAGIWSNKIPNYLNFIKKISLKDLLNHQKKIYKLDLASKGLGGISKDQFWQEIDNLIIELCSN